MRCLSDEYENEYEEKSKQDIKVGMPCAFSYSYSSLILVTN